MTILFLSRLFSPHIGGVETHLLEISKRLIAEKHRVVIVTEKFESSLTSHEIINGIEVYRINPGKEDWFKKFHIWRELFKIQELISQADIVHAHDVFFWYLPFRFLYPFKKVYTTFHGYETQVPPRKGAIMIRKLSEIFSNGNICVGGFIPKWYGTKANYVTYGGVNSSTFRENKNKKLNITFIGRLEKDLGLPVYFKVLEKLKEKNIKFTFDAYGDGSLREKVQTYGTAHGFIQDISKALRDSDIVFVSSYLSMLDALANKKLVIAVYDNDLKKDYLTMSPFAKYVIVENDAQKIVEKIVYYQNHTKEKQTFINYGYNWAKTQTWEGVRDLYKKLWHIK